MANNTEKIVLSIAGALVGGFLFGLGFTTAQNLVNRRREDKAATPSNTEGTSGFDGAYKPQRRVGMAQGNGRKYRAGGVHHEGNMPSQDFTGYNGNMPQRKSSFSDLANFDFTTGQSW